jgi:predicted aspartyl protease
MDQTSTNGTCYTGGSGYLEPLLRKLLHSNAISEQGQSPKLLKRGKDLKDHLRRVENYAISMEFDEKTKCAFLVNSLEESIQFELFSYYDYSAHSQDYSWITDKLCHILGGRSSNAGPLMEMLKIKQRPDQSLREFVTEIRINATRIMGIDSDPSQRESFMVAAFINGLHNKRAAVALQNLNPQSLEDCFKLVKKEIPSHHVIEEAACLAINNDTSLMESLKNQIRLLQNQVNYLLSCVPRQQTVSPPLNYSGALKANNYKRPTVPMRENFSNRNNLPARNTFIRKEANAPICYNCGGLNHFARECKNVPVCRWCKKMGHNSRDCEQMKSRPVRRIYEEVLENVDSVPPDNFSDVETSIKGEVEPSLCVISEKHKLSSQYPIHSRDIKKVTMTKTKSSKGDRSNETDVEKWVSFIKGNGKKPKQTAPTLISTSRPERAANKPLVNATVEKMPVKILFDTGAEINVIDENFLNILRQVNPSIMVQKVESYIRCANDSRMKALGKVILSINLDGVSLRQSFTVVSSIFPKIIVGIREMKKCGISVDPKNDCIWVKGKVIPFVSKVLVPIQEKQGNFHQLAPRA